MELDLRELLDEFTHIVMVHDGTDIFARAGPNPTAGRHGARGATLYRTPPTIPVPREGFGRQLSTAHSVVHRSAFSADTSSLHPASWSHDNFAPTHPHPNP
jgi:hypothetical protein